MNTFTKCIKVSKNEHLHEHFMNTFVNTLQETMNTMNTVHIYIPFFIKIIQDIRSMYIRTKANVRECVYSKSVHCVHLLKKSVHDCVHFLFIRLFIFGGFENVT